MTHHSKAGRGIFFGWVVVGTSFLLGMLTGGLHAYSRGIFLKPIAAELGASRTDLSLGFTITTVVAALVSPLAGYLLDRYSPKKLIAAAVIWTALGYIALGLIESRWSLFIILGFFFGVGTFSISGLAVPKLVVNWFTKRRGLAISLAAMGASAAGIIAPPLSTFLIDTLGWRDALFCFAAITLSIALPLVALLKAHPAELGLYPDNLIPIQKPAESESVRDSIDQKQLTRREYLTNGSFWGLVLIFGTQTGMFQGVSIHLFAHLTDIGVSQQRTALALSLMATCAMLSKPLFGWMVDNWSPRLSVTISISSEVAALLLFLLSTGYGGIMLAAALFGFGYGAMNPLRNGITAMIFGGTSFGSVAGALRPMMLPLGVVGLLLGGWIYDSFHNYDLMFQIFIGFYLISLLGLIPIRRPSVLSHN